MPLEDEDSFVHRNLAVRGRAVCLAIEIGIVRLIVDSGEQHPCNSDNRFLVTTAFLEREVTVADFRETLGTHSVESALNEQWLDVGSGSTDSGGFLFPSALVVLRRKPCPGAKVLRRWETRTYPLRFQR